VPISDLTISQAITQQLGQQEATIAGLERQLSSGRALNTPSDDPVAVAQVLQLSGQSAQIATWQSNASAAASWLGVANNTANAVLDQMQSARTVLLQALNQGSQTATSYQAMSTQLQGIAQTILASANTQYEGRAMFAGTAAVTQAYDASGNYLGNTDTPSVVIGAGAGPGQTSPISVPGSTLFGVGPASVFTTLSTVVGQLAGGAPTAAQLNAALSALDANIAVASQGAATLGEATQQAASASSALTTQLQAVQSTQSGLENVNIATVTSQLTSQLTNYQAAMWAASKAIPETLDHFM
jgi:flagellar hook-associated protein 3 FlgL